MTLAPEGGLPWRGLRILGALRRRPPFLELPKAEWATFIAIASLWDRDGFARVSQQAIARSAGYSERWVRTAIAGLERRRILELAGDLPPDDSAVACYRPGAATMHALDVPRGSPAPAGVRRRHRVTPAEAASAPPPEATSSDAELASATPRKPLPPLGLTNTNTKDSFNAPPPPSSPRSPASNEEQEVLLSSNESNDEIVRTALTEWARRCFPGARSPQQNRADRQRVGRCAAAIEGDTATKLQALRDSIAGALLVSEGPPTGRFIWGNIEHFLAHVERGRSLRVPEEIPRPAARPPRPQSTDSATPTPARESAGVQAIAVDLDKLFGPGWRTKR